MSDGDAPHYVGHRERLRTRVVERGADSLADYEILESLLFSARPRGDVKPLAKALLSRFGTLSAVLGAAPDRLKTVPGVGDAAVAALKVAQEAGRRLAREQASARSVIASFQALIDYCRVTLAEEPVERFHILFLDKKHNLIADETQGRGTVDHTPVYIREVVKRALFLEASGLILVHNHPSGDTKPSKADIEMTRKVVEAAKPFNVAVHDHIIISRSGHTSFRNTGLI